MKITRKLLPLLAAVQLAMAGAGTAQAAYLSVGYFNGGGDVTAGPGGDINKLDVRADHPPELLVWPDLQRRKRRNQCGAERPGVAAIRSGYRQRWRPIWP